MTIDSPLLLIGIGTSGCKMAVGVSRAFGGDLRALLLDTDAVSDSSELPFVLLGGERFAGHGAGGDLVNARLAAEDSIRTIDEHLSGARLAIIVTALGGGTGGGVTYEAVKHLSALGIRSVVFATTPFRFEGESRQNSARGIMPMIEGAANATFFLPLDKLVQDEDNLELALQRAIDQVANGVSLFGRLIAKPGYIRLDLEQLRQMLGPAGRGRFAVATVQGPDRAQAALDQLVRSELLTLATAPLRVLLCGVLAGEDLRLSELTALSNGLRKAFGENIEFHLGTVNDEATFCGRLSVVVMLFEGVRVTKPSPSGGRDKPSALGGGPIGRGRFNNAEPTEWRGEDLDVPTFIRRNISLDF